MPIILGKKSMEVDQIFNAAGLKFKPMKITLDASETPKETIINLEVIIQCELVNIEKVSLWKRVRTWLSENSKCLFSSCNC